MIWQALTRPPPPPALPRVLRRPPLSAHGRPGLIENGLKGAGAPDAPQGGPAAESQKKPAAQTAPDIVCRQCRQAITTTDARISVDGRHRHVFANPHGLVFEIGCFNRIHHCGVSGPATAEFTWFAGYAWKVVFCGRCLTHLGWSFHSAADAFYGLIAQRIIEPPV
jgi:hypothetical protein